MLEEKNAKANNDVIDIELPEIAKKKVRFDGDNNRVVYIDPSDMGIVSRLEEALPKLKTLTTEACEELSETGEDKSMGTTLTEIDEKMRNLIDYIFDAPLSAAAVPSGNMYALHNGVFTFEHIIEVMAKQYENNFENEFNKLNARLKNYTGKYTKSKGKRK